MTLKILWGALLVSHFIYAFVLYTVNQSYEGEKELANPMMLPVMASLALCAYAAGFFLFNTLVTAQKKKFQNPTVDELATMYLAPMIIRLALFEAAAMMGFVLAFKSHDINYFLPPLCINILLFVMNFPSEEKIKNAFA